MPAGIGRDLGRAAVRADREAAKALHPLANTRMLSAIQRGSLGSGYFRMLARALGNARLRGPAILTDLGEIDTPDILGEVADLLYHALVLCAERGLPPSAVIDHRFIVPSRSLAKTTRPSHHIGSRLVPG